ncbi:MAG TPA: hypothetical protein PK765_07860 [bacterium]|nr:hypothetical protein [bacterium]
MKQIYPSYKGRFKDASGEEIFIHISERQILEAFLKIVVKMVSDFSQKFLMAYEGEITMTATQVVAREGTNMKNSQTAELFRKNVEESKRSGEQMMPQEGLDAFADAIDDYVCKLGLLTAGREFFDQQPGGFAKHLEKSLAKAKKKKALQGMSEDYFARKLLMDKGMELYRESGKPYVFNEETGYDPIGSLDRRFRTAKQTVGRSIAVERIAEALKKQFDTNTRDFKEAKANQVRALEKRKEEIESERKNYRREALKMGYAREEIEETTKDMDSDLRALESRISDLSRDTEMERYLDRLPEMLLETVELASNGISRAKIEDLRADLKTLLEISTVELTVTNKKELQVKLFEVLEGLISSDGDLLDTPTWRINTRKYQKLLKIRLPLCHSNYHYQELRGS